jgi:hypothetical protein
MPTRNLLIGNGERLFSDGDWARSGRTKPDPYTLQQQRHVLHPALQLLAQLATTTDHRSAPRGEICGKITLHPQFLAKSYFPQQLLRQSSLRLVGSRSAIVRPRAMVRGTPVQPGASARLIVAGTAEGFARADHFLMSNSDDYRARHTEFRRIESIELFGTADRLRVDITRFNGWTEVVIHAGVGDADIKNAFAAFVREIGGEIDVQRMRTIGGLTFAPIRFSPQGIDAVARLAEFSHLRVIRNLPVVEVDQPAPATRTRASGDHVMPDAPANSDEIRAVIFDGGFPHDTLPWVNPIDAPGVPQAQTDLAHGTSVTSAFLFGALTGDEAELPLPYCNVDHVRVLPSATHDWHAFDVIDRVIAHLKDARDRGLPYHLANLSLGPRLPMLDDDPHEWTVRLDDVLALGDIFMTVAVGNDGVEGPELGRIQPPSDGVNVFAVGASDRPDAVGQRADYSCVGPGRSPGLVKPDVLAFGGSTSHPLILFEPISGGMISPSGTSLSAPLALRIAAGIQSTVQEHFEPIMLQALMVSQAQFNPRRHDQCNVGWGLLPATVDEVLFSPADEVVVLYQGEISEGRPIRARIPIPPGLADNDRVQITATFAYRAPIDPAHPVNYTQAGLEVRFQPDGIASTSFFGRGIFETEQELRADALKWETCRKKRRKFSASALTDPSFLISYQTREEGHPRPRTSSNSDDAGDDLLESGLPFALVIRIKIEGVEDIAERVLTAFEVLQHIPLRAEVEVQT